MARARRMIHALLKVELHEVRCAHTLAVETDPGGRGEFAGLMKSQLGNFRTLAFKANLVVSSSITSTHLSSGNLVCGLGCRWEGRYKAT